MLRHTLALLAALNIAVPIPPVSTLPSTESDDQQINAAIHTDSICPPSFYNQSSYGNTRNTYNFSVGGCEIELGPGTYFLKNSIIVDRPGVWFTMKPRTTILIKRGTVPAFVISATTYIEGNGSFVIAALNPYDLPYGTNVVPLVQATSTFIIEHLTLDSASGDCIFLSADAPHYHTVGDMWRLNYSGLLNCGGSGIWVQGGDSNTGVAIGNLADHTCQAADDAHSPRPKFDPVTHQPRCAGFADASFLGNTWIGNQSQLSGYGYLAVQGSARSLFLNNYSESDEKCAYINAPSEWIGGVCGIPEGSASMFVDGALKARYLYQGPWMTLHQTLGVAPTSTVGSAVGERRDMLNTYAIPGQCSQYILSVQTDAKRTPKWMCTQRITAP